MDQSIYDCLTLLSYAHVINKSLLNSNVLIKVKVKIEIMSSVSSKINDRCNLSMINDIERSTRLERLNCAETLKEILNYVKIQYRRIIDDNKAHSTQSIKLSTCSMS